MSRIKLCIVLIPFTLTAGWAGHSWAERAAAAERERVEDGIRERKHFTARVRLKQRMAVYCVSGSDERKGRILELWRNALATGVDPNAVLAPHLERWRIALKSELAILERNLGDDQIPRGLEGFGDVDRDGYRVAKDYGEVVLGARGLQRGGERTRPPGTHCFHACTDSLHEYESLCRFARFEMGYVQINVDALHDTAFETAPLSDAELRRRAAPLVIQREGVGAVGSH